MLTAERQKVAISEVARLQAENAEMRAQLELSRKLVHKQEQLLREQAEQLAAQQRLLQAPMEPEPMQEPEGNSECKIGAGSSEAPAHAHSLGASSSRLRCRPKAFSGSPRGPGGRTHQYIVKAISDEQAQELTPLIAVTQLGRHAMASSASEGCADEQPVLPPSSPKVLLCPGSKEGLARERSQEVLSDGSISASSCEEDIKDRLRRTLQLRGSAGTRQGRSASPTCVMAHASGYPSIVAASAPPWQAAPFAWPLHLPPGPRLQQCGDVLPSALPLCLGSTMPTGFPAVQASRPPRSPERPYTLSMVTRLPQSPTFGAAGGLHMGGCPVEMRRSIGP